MANGYNRVTLIGNLGKDPEVRYTQSGTAVTSMRIAVTEKRKDGPDGWKDHTEWVSCVAFGKTAESCGQYLAKGRLVHVEGKLQTKKFQNKEGQEREATEVIITNILFLAGGKDGDAPARPREERVSPLRQNGNGKVAPSEDAGFIDDDLPF